MPKKKSTQMYSEELGYKKGISGIAIDSDDALIYLFAKGDIPSGNVKAFVGSHETADGSIPVTTVFVVVDGTHYSAPMELPDAVDPDKYCRGIEAGVRRRQAYPRHPSMELRPERQSVQWWALVQQLQPEWRVAPDVAMA